MNTMDSSIQTIDINTKLLVSLMMLMFLDFAGYGYYVFYLPLLYFILHKGFNLIDKTFVMLFLFGSIYGFINWVNTETFRYLSTPIFFINMPILYLMGKYIARYNFSHSLIAIFFLFSLSLSFMPLISVLKDISINGFYVIELGRNIQVIGISDNGEDIAATFISSLLIPLSFFYIFLLLPFQKKWKIFYIFCGLLAIYCVLRIQSRTAIVGCIILLVLATFLTWNSRTFKQRFLLVLGIVIIVSSVIVVLYQFSDQLAVLERFQDDNTKTGGGRLELKLDVIDHMMNYPLGGMQLNYAHDLWFDTARVAGIIPFLLVICITINFLYTLYKFLILSNQDMVLRFTIGFLSFAIILIFSAEPVLEGLPMCFAFFCVLFGVIKETNKELQ